MPPKVSEEHKDRIRDSIILAALWSFSKNGYNETTMDDIVKESKLSKGTLYNYFKTKEELYLAYIRKNLGDFQQALEMRIKEFPSFSAKLENLMRFYIFAQTLKPTDFIQSDIETWAVSLKSDFLRTSVNEIFQFHTDVFRKIIQDGIKAGEFKSDIDIHSIITCFLGSINESVIFQAFSQKPTDWIKLGNFIVPILLKEIIK